MREIVPPIAAPTNQIYATDLTTYGAWFTIDARPAIDSSGATGFGLGYTKSLHHIFPRECSFVVQVSTGRDVEAILEMFRNSNIGGESVCIASSDNSD